jgi:hypothetical protein
VSSMTSFSSNGNIAPALKHPLQRLHSPSLTASLILHTLGLVDFAKCFEYLHAHPNPINQSYGWHFQYLTILGTFCLKSAEMLKPSRPSRCDPHIHCRNSGGRNQLEASFQGQECTTLPGCSGNTFSPAFVCPAHNHSSKH